LAGQPRLRHGGQHGEQLEQFPHFLGGKELINATFFAEPFAIRNTSFENNEMLKRPPFLLSPAPASPPTLVFDKKTWGGGGQESAGAKNRQICTSYYVFV